MVVVMPRKKVPILEEKSQLLAVRLRSSEDKIVYRTTMACDTVPGHTCIRVCWRVAASPLYLSQYVPRYLGTSGSQHI